LLQSGRHFGSNGVPKMNETQKFEVGFALAFGSRSLGCPLYPYLAYIPNQAGVFEDRFRRTLEVADRPAPAIHGHSLGSVRAVEIARGESRHAVPHFSLIYPVSARMFGKSDVDRISGRTVGIVGEHKGQ